MTRPWRAGSIAWAWLIVLGVLATLSWMGFSYQHEFTTLSRLRGCVSNQHALDKAIAVWESQYQPLPEDRAIQIDFASDGTIARTSPALDTWQAAARVPVAALLTRGSSVIFKYTKDVGLFQCPGRYQFVALSDEMLQERLRKQPEIHYRFLSSPRPLPELGGRKRGVICELFGEIGPRDDLRNPHAWEP